MEDDAHGPSRKQSRISMKVDKSRSSRDTGEDNNESFSNEFVHQNFSTKNGHGEEAGHEYV